MKPTGASLVLVFPSAAAALTGRTVADLRVPWLVKGREDDGFKSKTEWLPDFGVERDGVKREEAWDAMAIGRRWVSGGVWCEMNGIERFILGLRVCRIF